MPGAAGRSTSANLIVSALVKIYSKNSILTSYPSLGKRAHLAVKILRVMTYHF